jgi:hypothetical protein
VIALVLAFNVDEFAAGGKREGIHARFGYNPEP